MPDSAHFEVLIIGGSYAGLSAAMALGRCRRAVLVLDAAQPRNRFTAHAHNLLLHDGDAPADLAARARQQLAAYPSITLLAAEATSAEKRADGTFLVSTAGHGNFTAGRLLLATGLRDELPPLSGFAECWGRSIIHCPFCHGYEVADQPTGLWLNGDLVSHMVPMLLNWTRQLTVFTNGPASFGEEIHQQLAAQNVALVETPIIALLHTGSQLDGLGLTDGRAWPLAVLYAGLPWQQASDLPAQLGCELAERNLLRIDDQYQTNVPGVYAAGDCCSMGHQLVQAMAAGNAAGVALSRQLIFGHRH